jgi:hypothetical protein
LEQRFGYGLEELARRFDRSVSWVSRRLALVELLPEAIQQQVREGKISAHVAMKFLVPVARINLEDCQRMAAVFASITATRGKPGNCMPPGAMARAAIRKRILDAPDCSSKRSGKRNRKPASDQASDLLRDLEMAAAIVNRAIGGWPARRPRRWIARNAKRRGRSSMQTQLGRLAERIPRSKSRMLSQAQRTTILELTRRE